MSHHLLQFIHQHFQSWFSQAHAVVNSEENWVELPQEMQTELLEKIINMPCPQQYQEAIQGAIATGIDRWQQHLEASNCLILLGSPVESIPKILNESLQAWADPPLDPSTPLSGHQRPHDPLTFSAQLQAALEAYPQIQIHPTPNEPVPGVNSLADRTSLIVIPRLDECFLRCIGGWEGVDFLRNLIIQNQNCFWVIGCSHWAWNFLDFVSQISAYFYQITSLPKLDGEALKQWLDPLVQTTVKPNFLEDSAETENLSEAYWELLANQAAGVSSIAAHLWLKSLRIEGDRSPDEPISEAETDVTLRQTKPTLPSLPSLTGGDRYLIHSLLIHGEMTATHLALSLGEPESQILGRIQYLLRQGIFLNHHSILSIHPAHYIRLKTELTSNNFFVGDH